MGRLGWVVVVSCLLISGCGGVDQKPVAAGIEVAPDIADRRAQFVEKSLTADISHLSPGDHEALRHLVDASRTINEIFKIQAWAGNPGFAATVAALEGPDATAAQDYYRIMVGPWDRLTHYEPFLGNKAHPKGAGYYPEDLTEEEFEAWLELHPEDREALTSLHTIVRRSGDGLVAVPYSEFFAAQLEVVAAELRAAAAATDNESLRRFLELRADAFFSDDYYESDMAWMDLDSAIEVVIGPYETYEDQLFGFKAAFESFICVSQPEDSARLDVFKSELPYLERKLPIPDEHKNFDRGTESPIRVVDEIFTGGDNRAGVQTIAFNLPNDERVREAKGSKKVLLKNVMRAKYDGILVPIAERVLSPEGLELVGFEAFYQFTLHHELSHGIGPGVITVDGRETEVRLELKDLYSAFEEAKADVLGVYDIYVLVEKGVMDAEILGFAAVDLHRGHVPHDPIRSCRSARARHGPAGQLPAREQRDRDHRRRPLPAGAGDLRADVLGSRARAADDPGDGRLRWRGGSAERYGSVHPAMEAAITSLTDLPVDIEPPTRWRDCNESRYGGSGRSRRRFLVRAGICGGGTARRPRRQVLVVSRSDERVEAAVDAINAATVVLRPAAWLISGTRKRRDEVVETARKVFGQPEIVVANAGGPPGMPAVDATADDLASACELLLLPVQRSGRARVCRRCALRVGDDLLRSHPLRFASRNRAWCFPTPCGRRSRDISRVRRRGGGRWCDRQYGVSGLYRHRSP